MKVEPSCGIGTPMQCGAKTRASGLCKAKPMTNGRCRMHGGATPTGIALPHFKHGKYSKYMPEKINERFQELLADPVLTQLRPEIALVTQQLEEKLARLHAGESAGLWERSCKLLEGYCGAIQGASPDAHKGKHPNEILDALKNLLAHGERTYNIFTQIQPLLEQHRKLVDTENRRQQQLNQTFTAEQAIAFVRQLGDSIKRNVPEAKQRNAIFQDFGRALNR